MTKDIVIIGGGLGGLECGYILSKHGMKVTVLEAASTLGGCLQTFKRKGLTFDTGFHYVGGLGEGECLHPFFNYFGLTGLPWKKLDPDCFEKIVFSDASYCLASGYKAFEDRLCAYFPAEREGIRKMVSCYKEVSSHISDNLYPGKENPANELLARGAGDFLNAISSNRRLRDVLCGSALKMELSGTLPLYVFCEVNGSFIQSSWRLEGGGARIAEALAASIRGMGGEVRTGARVTSVIEDAGTATGVTLAGGETIPARTVISDIHPASLLALIPECRQVRRSFRSRISSLENTFGMFTANLVLKEGALPYENRNVFVHADGADLMHPDPRKTESVMISYYPSGSDRARAIDLLSPMAWELVEGFGGKPGQRGDGYQELKEKKLNECIALASKAIPALRDAIDYAYTSTPLTYLSYTGAPCGSAYGIRKDWHAPMTTMLSPRTPLENLYMTGQNLYLHGILGTTMTSVFTCSQILGSENLAEEILKK